MATRSYFNPVACYNTALRYYAKQAARAKFKSEGIKLSYVDNLMLWQEAERQLKAPEVIRRAQELVAYIESDAQRRKRSNHSRIPVQMSGAKVEADQC
jgi:hypothetical protein